MLRTHLRPALLNALPRYAERGLLTLVLISVTTLALSPLRGEANTPIIALLCLIPVGLSTRLGGHIFDAGRRRTPQRLAGGSAAADDRPRPVWGDPAVAARKRAITGRAATIGHVCRPGRAGAGARAIVAVRDPGAHPRRERSPQ